MANKKPKGIRAKTRYKFRSKGKVSPNKLIADIKEGSIVAIDINSSYHKGMPFRRYQGKTGKVIGKQGSAYLVRVSEGNARRVLIVSSAHLNVLKGA